jgi:hypothetical protein
MTGDEAMLPLLGGGNDKDESMLPLPGSGNGGDGALTTRMEG